MKARPDAAASARSPTRWRKARSREGERIDEAEVQRLAAIVALGDRAGRTGPQATRSRGGFAPSLAMSERSAARRRGHRGRPRSSRGESAGPLPRRWVSGSPGGKSKTPPVRHRAGAPPSLQTARHDRAHRDQGRDRSARAVRRRWGTASISPTRRRDCLGLPPKPSSDLR